MKNLVNVMRNQRTQNEVSFITFYEAEIISAMEETAQWLNYWLDKGEDPCADWSLYGLTQNDAVVSARTLIGRDLTNEEYQEVVTIHDTWFSKL